MHANTRATKLDHQPISDSTPRHAILKSDCSPSTWTKNFACCGAACTRPPCFSEFFAEILMTMRTFFFQETDWSVQQVVQLSLPQQPRWAEACSNVASVTLATRRERIPNIQLHRLLALPGHRSAVTDLCILARLLSKLFNSLGHGCCPARCMFQYFNDTCRFPQPK